MKNKNCFRLSLIFVISTLNGCNSKNDTWKVPLVGLPPKISSELAHSNSVAYILRQTHEPIFRSGDNNNIYSNILLSWKRSEDSKDFRFCVKPGLEFITSKPFTSKQLHEALLRLKQKIEIRSIDVTEDCVQLQLKNSIPRLFDMLTSYEFAPEIQNSNSPHMIGLGPYQLASASKSILELTRKSKKNNSYNKIQFLKLSEKETSLNNAPDIEDFNRIPFEKIPDSVKNSYNSYPVPLLKTYGLLLNIQDIKTRQHIYNCLNIGQLRKVFFPSLNNPIFLSTILPLGIEGAREGKVEQNCRKKLGGKKKGQFKFANWKHDLNPQLTDFFNEQSKSLNFDFKVNNIDQSELITSLYGSHSEYNLLIIAIDTDTDEYLPFFEPFLDDKKKIHSVNLDHLKPFFSKLIGSHTKSEAASLAVDIDKLLRKEAIFIPLVQDVRTFYFPQNLSNLVMGNNFLGNIEVGKLTP